MVEGNPNPKILHFFCATPKCAPALAPADEAEEVDSPSVRAGLALNAPTSKLDVDKRGVHAPCPCAESFSC
jgi:hypothetical protein